MAPAPSESNAVHRLPSASKATADPMAPSMVHDAAGDPEATRSSASAPIPIIRMLLERASLFALDTDQPVENLIAVAKRFGMPQAVIARADLMEEAWQRPDLELAVDEATHAGLVYGAAGGERGRKDGKDALE